MKQLRVEDFKSIRKKNGLSLRKVSKETGINYTTIYRIETGEIKDIKLCTYIKLNEFYNTFN